MPVSALIVVVGCGVEVIVLIAFECCSLVKLLILSCETICFLYVLKLLLRSTPAPQFRLVRGGATRLLPLGLTSPLAGWPWPFLVQ